MDQASTRRTLEPPAADTAAAEIRRLIYWAGMCQALRTAVELDLPDLMAGGAHSVRDLARATGAQEGALRRLLRALSAVGFCAETQDDVFGLQAVGEALRRQAEASMRSVLLWHFRYQWSTWADMGVSIKTGLSAREQAIGMGSFARLEQDPEMSAIFDGAMSEMTRVVAGEVVRLCDFSTVGTVVDVGGGRGRLLSAVMRANPHLRGVLFDLAHVVSEAAKSPDRLAPRMEMRAGDFFRDIPPSADVCLLKNVIHDWDDQKSLTILRNCRSALPPGGRVVIIERVVPRRTTRDEKDLAIAWMDLMMLIGPGGRERTAAEFCDLLRESGFAGPRFTETATEYTIIEAAVPG
jgi:SAM-dependent methyltransferase